MMIVCKVKIQSNIKYSSSCSLLEGENDFEIHLIKYSTDINLCSYIWDEELIIITWFMSMTYFIFLL